MIIDYSILTIFFEQKNKIITSLISTVKKYKLDIFLSPDYIFPFYQEKIENYFKHRINKKVKKSIKFIPSIFIECFYNQFILPITISFENTDVLWNNKHLLNFLNFEIEEKKQNLKEIFNELLKKYELKFIYKPNTVYSIFNIAHNILLNNDNIINFKIDKYLLGNKSERPILNLTKDILSFKLQSFSKYFTNFEKLIEILNKNKNLILENKINIFLHIFSSNYKEELNKFYLYDFSGIIIEKNNFKKLKQHLNFEKIFKFPSSYFISEKFSPTISAGYEIESI